MKTKTAEDLATLHCLTMLRLLDAPVSPEVREALGVGEEVLVTGELHDDLLGRLEAVDREEKSEFGKRLEELCKERPQVVPMLDEIAALPKVDMRGVAEAMQTVGILKDRPGAPQAERGYTVQLNRDQWEMMLELVDSAVHEYQRRMNAGPNGAVKKCLCVAEDLRALLEAAEAES